MLLLGINRTKELGNWGSACGPSEARSRRARALGGGAPSALIKEGWEPG